MSESFLEQADKRASDTSGTAAAVPASQWGLLEFNDKRTALVKAAFEKEGQERVTLKAVHRLLFDAVERAEYDFDTFDTDAQATCPGCGDDMAWGDVQKFLEENL